jgi:hypothetical protein
MKVLVKDKIIESFKFPLTEALSFSILVWTIWGLAEAFYWQKLSPMFEKDSVRLSPYIFIASFFMYLAIAAVVAVLTFGIVRWVLFTMGKDDDQTFRSATLAGILGIFFLAVIYHCTKTYFSNLNFSQGLKWAIIGFSLALITFISVLFYRITSRLGFRIRRSGTLMFSVLVLSAVLSFVHFPSDEDRNEDLRSSIRKLMAHRYLSPGSQQ